VAWVVFLSGFALFFVFSAFPFFFSFFPAFLLRQVMRLADIADLLITVDSNGCTAPDFL